MPKPIPFSRRTFLLMPLALAACKPGREVLKFSGPTMGTTYNVVTVGTSKKMNAGEIQNAIDMALAETNQHLSNWDPRSEISRFNDAIEPAPFQMSSTLAEVMQAAEVVHRASEGVFDTTTGSLIELWGFGASGKPAFPASSAIEAALKRVGQTKAIHLDSGSIKRSRADAKVYLAGIGKGHGADRVARALEALGISDYMVEIGGDLYAAGKNPDGGPWQIGIETPESYTGGVLQVVGLSGLGLASSGDYRNYFERDGQRFSHIIDPTTGRPVTHNTTAATVLAENAMFADAWATAMLILGVDRGMEIAERHNVAVLFVERNGPISARELKSTRSSRFKELTT